MNAIKIIAGFVLLLGSFCSFGQVSYMDKGSGPAPALKTAARVMELLSENDLEDIRNYCTPNMAADSAALSAAAAQIADDYQASEGREPVIDLKEAGNGVYERTFYQVNDKGALQYLMQVRLTMILRDGRPLVNTIKVVNGPAIRKYDKLIGAGQDDAAETEPEAKPERKPRKNANEEEE